MALYGYRLGSRHRRGFWGGFGNIRAPIQASTLAPAAPMQATLNPNTTSTAVMSVLAQQGAQIQAARAVAAAQAVVGAPIKAAVETRLAPPVQATLNPNTTSPAVQMMVAQQAAQIQAAQAADAAQQQMDATTQVAAQSSHAAAARAAAQAAIQQMQADDAAKSNAIQAAQQAAAMMQQQASLPTPPPLIVKADAPSPIPVYTPPPSAKGQNSPGATSIVVPVSDDGVPTGDPVVVPTADVTPPPPAPSGGIGIFGMLAIGAGVYWLATRK